jgi:hypothetical protein
MFESFNPDDAISILKSDHAKVKGLFEEFEKSGNARHKKKIISDAIQELKIHAEIEEKIFYPTVRRYLEKDVMNEANEEHHVAKLLIAELDRMDGTEENYFMKFKVLAESVRHHIREEEDKMLPEARKTDIDFSALGEKLIATKEKLKENGVPPCAEEKMIARFGRRAGKLVKGRATNSKTAARKKAARNRSSRKMAKRKKAA